MIAWKQRVGKFNLAAWMCRTAGFVWSLAAGALAIAMCSLITVDSVSSQTPPGNTTDGNKKRLAETIIRKNAPPMTPF